MFEQSGSYQINNQFMLSKFENIQKYWKTCTSGTIVVSSDYIWEILLLKDNIL